RLRRENLGPAEELTHSPPSIEEPPMPSRPARRKPRPTKDAASSLEAWAPITAANLTDQVYSAMRAEIATGRLRPGDPIREADVAQALGVRRTPLREACARLASECFLERVPNRGYRIPAESPRELLNLYPIVAALEVLAAQTSLRQLSAEDLASLRAHNQEM